MEDPNMYIDIDDNAPESEKPLSQTSSAGEFQEHKRAEVDRAAKMPKASKKRRKTVNSEKKRYSTRSRPEHSSSTKSSDPDRALRRRCRTLKKECSSLNNSVTQLRKVCEKLESENSAILGKLIALGSSGEDPDSHTSTSDI